MSSLNAHDIRRAFRKFKTLVVSWPWNWANIIAFLSALLTFAALVFSIYQNKVSDNRYNDNEEDNKIELGRIRHRDSMQLQNQSKQTNALILELQEQQSENKRNRKKDSLQLSLYNKQLELLNKSISAQINGINIQSQDLQIRKILNKPDFKIHIDFNRIFDLTDSINIKPTISIKNIGNSIAYDVNIDYLLITMENNSNKVISESRFYEEEDTIINVNEEKIIKQSIDFQTPIDFKLYENGIMNLKYKEVFLRKYFIILHIGYKDKYNKENAFYSLNRIQHNINYFTPTLQSLKLNFLPLKLRTTPFLLSDLIALKNNLKIEMIDYEAVYKIYKSKNLQKTIVTVK